MYISTYYLLKKRIVHYKSLFDLLIKFEATPNNLSFFRNKIDEFNNTGAQM